MEAYRSGHNEAVLKTVWVKAHGGSNPSASANKSKGILFKVPLFLFRNVKWDSNGREKQRFGESLPAPA